MTGIKISVDFSQDQFRMFFKIMSIHVAIDNRGIALHQSENKNIYVNLYMRKGIKFYIIKPNGILIPLNPQIASF